MSVKKVPFSQAKIEEITKSFPTPFHIYDEQAIRDNVRRFLDAFSWAPAFKEYFAVKATPNPAILEILRQEGLGGDCSSLAELILCEKAGITGENIMFTSNNTPDGEFQKACELGAIINLDDITHIEFLEEQVGLPQLICFRYNPGPLVESGNSIIGYPEEAKYGLTKEQIFEAYKTVRDKGVKRFGIHTMVVSNELDTAGLLGTANMMFDLAVEIYQKLGIKLEFINLGGGIGVPYQLAQQPVDLEFLGKAIQEAYELKIKSAGLHPLKLMMECGRMITGPYGYLVSRVIHEKNIYKHYIGLDACMANLMRPALYGSYHHITVMGKENQPCDHVYDVTGSLCENNDKFAIDRSLPQIEIGDLVVIHDAGAHGHSMGFNYNGKLRSAELLLQADGSVKQIRRAETLNDYFATLDFDCVTTNLAAAAKK
ncbi:diaminopimelate decarboxylase [Sporomusaceae bacterium BoRhaA]|uniref:diaminopimelate decarboxylase n=1 Tax=Pelorhabdus rhamnosifermentans TaxID=2772457 RepID=UPI001C063E74|nr:diaminopimelate decarboxylase [Pelorhabdus rhamnosifermentans]MBU2703288.1 diaminopimelate decarboxylase [Pelorhabdus rhamnosifermentans]